MTANVRYVTARPELERFYHDLTSSAVVNGLSDAETVAILSTIIGRFVGASSGEDRQTFIDTTVHNIRQGAGEVPGLLAALKGGH